MAEKQSVRDEALHGSFQVDQKAIAEHGYKTGREFNQLIKVNQPFLRGLWDHAGAGRQICSEKELEYISEITEYFPLHTLIRLSLFTVIKEGTESYP